MSVASLASTCADDVAARYERDGFVSPLDIMSAADAQALRGDLESAEAQLAHDSSRLALLRSYPDRLLPSFDELIRNERLIAAASAVLGPDLMVWSAGLFMKDANSTKVVSWHQDLTYWGLDDAEETTCWVALSPSSKWMYEIHPRQPQTCAGRACGYLRRQQSSVARAGSHG